MRAYCRASWRLLLVVLWLVLGSVLALLFIRVDGVSAYTSRQRQLIRWWMRCLLSVMGVTLRYHQASTAPVWVSNHVSWCDIVALMAIEPSRFLSKAEVAAWPVIGWLANRVGTVFIARGGHQTQAAVAYLTQVIAAGGRVVFFPEGTSQGGEPLKFYPRLFALPIDTQTAVAPITLIYQDQQGQMRSDLSYTGTQSFFANLWHLLQQRGIVIEAHFARDINSDGLSRRELADACQEVIHERWQSHHTHE